MNYDEHDFIKACRLHGEALFDHYWLVGAGRFSDGAYDDEARKTAEADLRHRGWTLEQISDYKLAPEPLPHVWPKKTATKASSFMKSGDNIQDVIGAVYRRLGRKVGEPEPADEEQSRRWIKSILAGLARGMGA